MLGQSALRHEEDGGVGTGVDGSHQTFYLTLRSRGFVDGLTISCGLSFSSALSSRLLLPGWLLHPDLSLD